MIQEVHVTIYLNQCKGFLYFYSTNDMTTEAIYIIMDILQVRVSFWYLSSLHYPDIIAEQFINHYLLTIYSAK